MVGRNAVLGTLKWLVLTLVLAVLIFLQIFSRNGYSTLALHRPALLALIAFSALTLPAFAWIYVRNSNPVYGTFALIELRKRDPRAWLLRGLGATLCCTALAVFAMYMVLLQLAPYLHGPVVREAAAVTRQSHTRSCRLYIHYRLDDATEDKICVRRPFADLVPANISCARVNDRVTVEFKDTAIGMVATIVEFQPSAGDCT